MVFSLLAASVLSPAPQAVVFDWGKVLANPDRQPILSFLSKTFGVTLEEIEMANVQKYKTEIPEIEFWFQYAKKGQITLPDNWIQKYRTVTREALHIDAKMYGLVEELKAKGLRVALASNIQKRYIGLIRDFGLYAPFHPCLLSGEIGIEKPDPRVFKLLLKELSIPPSDVVFIDDLLLNVKAARDAGMDAIQFKSYSQLRQALTQKNLL